MTASPAHKTPRTARSLQVSSATKAVDTPRPATDATSMAKQRSRQLRLVLHIILYLFLAAGVLLVPQVLVYYPMSWFLGSRITQPFWAAIYSILSYVIALVLLFVIIIVGNRQRRQKQPAGITSSRPLFNKFRLICHKLGLEGYPKWSDLLLAPIGFVVYSVAATIITGLFSKFPFYDATETQTLGFGTPYFASDKILIFLAVAIVAPIAEELIFRGWLYGRLRAHIPGKANLFLSIILTSLLFAVLHGQFSVGLNVFCLSIVLCALREVTGRLHAGILLHILKNTIAFFLLFVI